MKIVTIWPNTQPVTCPVLNEFTDDEGTFYIVGLPDGDRLCIDKRFTETIIDEKIPLENTEMY